MARNRSMEHVLESNVFKRSGLVTAVALLAAVLAMPNQEAYARVITADETQGVEVNGLAGDITTLTDSVQGQLCAIPPVNEDQTACFTQAYVVAAGLVNHVGTVGVDLINRATSDNPGALSDQLYLTVSATADPTQFSVLWCWDSDREPG